MNKEINEEINEEINIAKYQPRYFSYIYMDKNTNIYIEEKITRHKAKPKQAARIALTAICHKQKLENIKVKFIIKEHIDNNDKKYFAYEGKKIELEQPVTIKCNDKSITYKYDYELKKISLEESEDLINDIKNKEIDNISINFSNIMFN